MLNKKVNLNNKTTVESIKGFDSIENTFTNMEDKNPKIAVEVCNISKGFGYEKVLKNVSVEFQKQKIHGVIGRNGSGKTVMLKCICGFLPLDGGQIRVNNQIIGKDCDFPKRTGVLIESPGFLPNESGYNNLKWLSQLSGNVPISQVNELIALVGLDTKSKKHVGKYSLGMRQRFGIAQALLENPDLLILDEPMNGLDKQGVANMRELFMILRTQGKTIILASHFAQDIDELCDIVFEMDQGVLAQIQ